MTTLRRKLIQTIEKILIPYLSDNPQTQDAIDYAKMLSEKLADSILELRAFSTDVKRGSDEWKEKLGNEVAEKSLEAAVFAGKKIKANPQKEIFELETMIDEQLARLPLNWRGFQEKEQDSFRKFLKDEREKGKELPKFIDWWMSDEWRVANPPWKLDTIKIKWLEAFKDGLKPSVEVKTDDNDVPLSY